MDRKSLVILSISFLLLIGWYPMISRLYPQKQQVGGTNTVVTGTGANGNFRGAGELDRNTGSPDSSAAGAPARDFEKQSQPGSFETIFPSSSSSSMAEQTLQLTNGLLRITLSSFGGGVSMAELLKYSESTACDKTSGTSNAVARSFVKLNTKAKAPSMSLLGGPSLQGDGVFQLVKTAAGARVEKALTNGLFVIKEFTLGSNYLVAVNTRLENRSLQPVGVPTHEWVVGTSAQTHVADEVQHFLVYWFNGTKAQKVDDSWFKNYTMGCVPGTPHDKYLEGQTDVRWAAVNSQFFTLAAIAATNSPAGQILARQISFPAPTPAQVAADPKLHLKPVGYQASLVYPAAIIQPNGVLERRFEFYAGPKEYQTLAKIGQDRRNEFDLIMDFGSFFGFFSKALLLSMNAIHSRGLSYGMAIILITVTIKIVFWPLTKASTQSMKRMATLQPQMKAIQEKYKADPKKMNTKLMEFMKENKVSPLGGCLPMMLQIPVFIGFFFMIQTAIELRGAGFLWACDLSQPDTVATLLGMPVNILPILMGATQLWQIRLTPPSPGMDPVQQKIMQYMPLMFMFFLYQYAAGLTLYWTVQNLLSIAQMKLTKNEPLPSARVPASSAVMPRPNK